MALFSQSDEERIRLAVEDAERLTSGEIRVCAEKSCDEDTLDRAANFFARLGMDKTALRNGVLIYIAVHDHKFAIIGDSGINAVVPEDFWDSTREAMVTHFRQGDLAGGIITGIRMAGEKLQAFFPYQEGDKNELPNDISYH
jgi:uncharacterized membrane protein